MYDNDARSRRPRLLQAALNGDREHPAAPHTPEELAVEARAAVEAGAGSLHLHPYDEDGRETLAAAPCAAALRAVRAACPGVPISLSTSAASERTLAEGGVGLEQVHHGDGVASWAVNRRVIARGHGIHTGLENTAVLPDGREASGAIASKPSMLSP